MRSKANHSIYGTSCTGTASRNGFGGGRRHQLVQALQRVVHDFINEFNFAARRGKARAPLRRRENGVPLVLNQLSDGERGLLTIVFDLTRRLAIANPEREDPISEARAIVLIDEIELHLHPQWQREVLRRFTETFRGCQFIVTTHSPQVIGEVPPRCLRVLLRENDRIMSWTPPRSFGLDSSRVLEELMGVKARNAEIDAALHELFELIHKEDFQGAHQSIRWLEPKLGADDVELTRARSLITFLRGRMRAIRNNAEPRSLMQHRCTAHATFRNYADKDGLRASLCAEQGGICCYCMKRIRPVRAGMKIEHWHCRDHYPTEQLNYRNLLAACTGNEGQPGSKQHCDTRKGNAPLSRNPADPSHHVENVIQYRWRRSDRIDGRDIRRGAEQGAEPERSLPGEQPQGGARRLNPRAAERTFEQERRAAHYRGMERRHRSRASGVLRGRDPLAAKEAGAMLNTRGELAFESVLADALLAGGYEAVSPELFDRDRAIFPNIAIEFIRGTQAAAWEKLEALHGENTAARVLHDLCKWLDTYGSLATLRHGFKCYGRTLRVAFFKAAHGLNAELEARYAANRVGLTRQLHYSAKHEKSLDVTLSVNGIPVATLELKNPLTGQTVDNAIQQYRQDRDPRERIFEFKKRTLVHFAVDTEAVHMTTRLAGSATHFLPFNRGCNGGAGNPRDPEGRTYRTAYLWEEVLARDSSARPARALPALADRRADHRRRPEGQEGNDDLPALSPAAGGPQPCRRVG